MMRLFLINLLPVICVLSAAFLAYHDKDVAWLFLLMALLSAHTFGRSDTKKDV